MNETPSNPATERMIIGATAEVDLPELNIFGLTCRVDTGAATCALHAHEVVYHEDESGNEFIEVVLFDPEHDLYTGKKLKFTDFLSRNVRNSFGTRQKRFMIKTRLVYHHHSFDILVGFSNRTKLTYDMLLGRNLLSKGFLVDVTH